MVRWLSYLFISLLAAAVFLWVGVQTATGQHLAKLACIRFIRSCGLTGSIERVDIALPLYIRLEGLVIQGPSEEDRPIFSCDELFLSPLLVDLPFGRITFLNIKGKGLSIDGDAMETYPSAAKSRGSWSWAVLRLHLSSVHVTSRRLPGREVDCSVRGKFSLSEQSMRLSCSLLKKDPSTWPKRLDIRVASQPSGSEATARIFLGTEDFSDKRALLFGPKDRLDVVLKATSSLDSVSGAWTLTCPLSTSPLHNDLLLTQSASGRGSFTYERNSSLSIGCDGAEKTVTVERPPSDLAPSDEAGEPHNSAPLYTATLSAQGELTSVPNSSGGYRTSLSLPKCSLSGFSGALSATVDVVNQEGETSATLLAEGQLQKGDLTIPIRGQASGGANDDEWSLAADLLAAPFRATLEFSSTKDETNGRGSVRCQDLSILEGVTAPIGGSAEISASMHSDVTDRRYSCTGNLSDFHWLDMACQNGTIRCTHEQEAIPSLSCNADMKDVRIGALRVDEFHAALSYDLHSHALNLLDATANGRIHELPFALVAAGEGATTKSEGVLTLDQIHGTIADHSISLDQPIRIGHKNNRLSSLTGALRIGTNGRIVGDWHSASPHRLIGDLSFENVPLAELMTAFNGPTALGTFDGQVHFQSTPREFSANASMRASIARFGVLGGSDGGLALGTTVTIEHGEGSAQVCIAGMGINEPLLVRLTTPIGRSSSWPFFSIDPRSPILGTIKGDIRLTQLLGGWLPDQAGLEGIIGCNASVSGTVQDPFFQGFAHVREGRIDLLPTGEVIKNIEMDGTLDHHKLSLHKVTASDEKEGRVSGTGLVEITPANDFHWQAALDCSNVEAISLDYATASADGAIKLDGDLDGMTISGSAIARKAFIDLAARFPSDTPEIPFVYIGEKPSDKSPFLVNFDLSVDAASGVEIRGRGLSSQWKGRLHLGGEASQLVLDGSLRCLEGSFCLSNKSLTISEGSVTVAGDLFLDSRLNVIANIVLPSIAAEVCLRGSLENPKISIRSTPPRPDTEILSLLLFNKEFGDISPLQSLQLANTAMNIEHPSGPFGFVDRVKENLGIDLIDVGTQTPTPTSATIPSALDPSDTGPPPIQLQNDVSIKVGKYISDGVAVTVSKIVGSDTNYVGFEAQLAPEITAEAQVGADQIGVLSLKWKKNY